MGLRWRIVIGLHLILTALMTHAADSDWPQWRGPNRDGIVPNSPKLLEKWPKDGPPLLWKSDWIPGCDEGGMGSPVIADGKVFLYVNWKQPVGSGQKYRPITEEALSDGGLRADLPNELARKIEDAWASTKRPSSLGFRWWGADRPSDEDVNTFLAGKPELDKYVKEFLAALNPADAKKYEAFIKRRMCINKEKINIDFFGIQGETLDNLAKLSKLKDQEFASYGEWLRALGKLGFNYGFHHKALATSAFNGMAWERSYKLFDTLICLDAATGKTLWKREIPEDMAVIKKIGNDRSFGIFGSCSTPAVWKDKCYFAGAAGLYCVSVKDGALLWQTPRDPSHASPLVANGIVFHAGIAYDAESGKQLWQSPLWKANSWAALQSFNSPVLWNANGKPCIVGAATSQYGCVELETGKTLWTIEKIMPHFAAPAIGGNQLIVCSAEFGRQAQAYNMTPSGVELTWKHAYGTGQGGAIFYKDHVYLCDALEGPAAWRCLDAKSGDVVWAKRALSFNSESIICWPLLADGKIVGMLGGAHSLWYHDNKGFAIEMFKATPNEPYVQLGQFEPGACPLSSPAFAAGKLYVRLLDRVACYDLQDHGVYLEGVSATPGSAAFRFKQTGGGLAGGLEQVQITDASGATKPAKAKFDGEQLVVDLQDAAPCKIAYAGGGALAGKNGQPAPAFRWDVVRLAFKHSSENMLVFASALPLERYADWNRLANFTVAGAKVLRVEIAPGDKNVVVTTDRIWKPGEAVTLEYPACVTDPGKALMEKIAFTTGAANGISSAKFVKNDEQSSGNWKGVYGAEGALIAGDPGAPAPKCASVTMTNKQDEVWKSWHGDPLSSEDPRNLQKSGDGRTGGYWHGDAFEIDVAINDGKEHQVALYCLDGTGNYERQMRVDVRDFETQALLDSQVVKGFRKGKYVIWHLQGHVTLRFTNLWLNEPVASGVFFDIAGK